MKQPKKRKNNPGAGRPPEGLMQVKIALPPEALKKLDSLRGDTPRGKFIAETWLGVKPG